MWNEIKCENVIYTEFRVQTTAKWHNHIHLLDFKRCSALFPSSKDLVKQNPKPHTYTSVSSVHCIPLLWVTAHRVKFIYPVLLRSGAYRIQAATRQTQSIDAYYQGIFWRYFFRYLNKSTSKSRRCCRNGMKAHLMQFHFQPAEGSIE